MLCTGNTMETISKHVWNHLEIYIKKNWNTTGASKSFGINLESTWEHFEKSWKQSQTIRKQTGCTGNKLDTMLVHRHQVRNNLEIMLEQYGNTYGTMWVYF